MRNQQRESELESDVIVNLDEILVHAPIDGCVLRHQVSSHITRIRLYILIDSASHIRL